MKKDIRLSRNYFAVLVSSLLLLFFLPTPGLLFAQDSLSTDNAAAVVKTVKPVKSTFNSVWLIDNQTVMVPIKGTLEMDIQHRFGTVKNGKKDFWGLFAPSNIRLGLGYAPIDNLFVGVGLAKERMQVDLSAKYALFRQKADNSMPISVSWFSNMVIDAREKINFRSTVHRFSYFNQLIIARKITSRFSAQVAPDFSWFNNVEAYVNKDGIVKNKMENGHFACSLLGRYKVTEKSSVIAGYDQPITEHTTNNPHPNICFGFETTTSSHAFQVFAGNYYGLVPQSNNFFNQNDFTKGQFLIGFNITRLWNF